MCVCANIHKGYMIGHMHTPNVLSIHIYTHNPGTKAERAASGCLG